MKALPEGLAIRQFNPLTASRRDWSRWHEYRHQRDAESRPDDPPYPDELAEKSVVASFEDPDHDRLTYVVDRGERVIAALSASWSTESSPAFETNKHLAHFWVYVLASERRRGIGTALTRHVLELVDPRHSVLSTGTEEDSGHSFLRRLGFEERIKGAENRLDLRELDWSMVNDWVAEGARRSPETKLEYFVDRVPEEMLDEFCAMRSMLLNLMPFDDLDHGEIVVTPENLRRQLYRWIDESGSTWHCALALEADGSIAGMTDVAYLPTEPDRIHQFLTGVRESSRGRGLGKWLKADMLRFVHERYPDARWVITDNATSNAPMLAINRRLGFREYRANSGYQIERNMLAANLAKL